MKHNFKAGDEIVHKKTSTSAYHKYIYKYIFIEDIKAAGSYTFSSSSDKYTDSSLSKAHKYKKTNHSFELTQTN